MEETYGGEVGMVFGLARSACWSLLLYLSLCILVRPTAVDTTFVLTFILITLQTLKKFSFLFTRVKVLPCFCMHHPGTAFENFKCLPEPDLISLPTVEMQDPTSSELSGWVGMGVSCTGENQEFLLQITVLSSVACHSLYFQSCWK